MGYIPTHSIPCRVSIRTLLQCDTGCPKYNKKNSKKRKQYNLSIFIKNTSCETISFTLVQGHVSYCCIIHDYTLYAARVKTNGHKADGGQNVKSQNLLVYYVLWKEKFMQLDSSQKTKNPDTSSLRFLSALDIMGLYENFIPICNFSRKEERENLTIVFLFCLVYDIVEEVTYRIEFHKVKILVNASH